jgi:hypothetical protein
VLAALFARNFFEPSPAPGLYAGLPLEPLPPVFGSGGVYLPILYDLSCFVVMEMHS